MGYTGPAGDLLVWKLESKPGTNIVFSLWKQQVMLTSIVNEIKIRNEQIKLAVDSSNSKLL